MSIGVFTNLNASEVKITGSGTTLLILAPVVGGVVANSKTYKYNFSASDLSQIKSDFGSGASESDTHDILKQLANLNANGVRYDNVYLGLFGCSSNYECSNLVSSYNTILRQLIRERGADFTNNIVICLPWCAGMDDGETANDWISCLNDVTEEIDGYRALYISDYIAPDGALEDQTSCTVCATIYDGVLEDFSPNSDFTTGNEKLVLCISQSDKLCGSLLASLAYIANDNKFNHYPCRSILNTAITAAAPYHVLVSRSTGVSEFEWSIYTSATESHNISAESFAENYGLACIAKRCDGDTPRIYALHTYHTGGVDAVYDYDNRLRVMYYLCNFAARNFATTLGEPLTFSAQNAIKYAFDNEVAKAKAAGALEGNAELVINTTSDDMTNARLVFSFAGTAVSPVATITFDLSYTNAGYLED